MSGDRRLINKYTKGCGDQMVSVRKRKQVFLKRVAKRIRRLQANGTPPRPPPSHTSISYSPPTPPHPLPATHTRTHARTHTSAHYCTFLNKTFLRQNVLFSTICISILTIFCPPLTTTPSSHTYPHTLQPFRQPLVPPIDHLTK